MEIHRFKQLRPKVVNNHTCMSQTEDFDTLYSENKYRMKKNQTYVVGVGVGGRGLKTYIDGTSQNHRTDAILRSIHNLRTRANEENYDNIIKYLKINTHPFLLFSLFKPVTYLI